MKFKLKNLLKEQSRVWNMHLELERAKRDYKEKRKEKFSNISIADISTMPASKIKELER